MRVTDMEVKRCKFCYVPIMNSYGDWIHWGWNGRDANICCDNSCETKATPEEEE